MKNCNVKYKLLFIVPVVTLLSGCANYKNMPKNKDSDDKLQDQVKIQKTVQPSSFSIKGDTLIIWSQGYHFDFCR